ncbi:MAG: heparinase II/III family protein [Alphaproteobacteria bacterium]|jgi:uncharacterized heparinase superfamily protein|nr:heparinase II/III family protein [Alphaproteobacteria bacterium]
MTECKKKSAWFLKSRLYYFLLGKPNFDRLNNIICYKRKGTIEKGLKIILTKQFDYGGQNITVNNFKKMFKASKENNNLWDMQINSFAWLRDLQEVGSNDARLCARKLINDWIKENSTCNEINWQSQLIGKRLFFLISNYNFYGRSASREFKHMLFNSMHKQQEFLRKQIKNCKEIDGYNFLQGLKGLLFSYIYIPKQKERVKEILPLLEKSLHKQILEEGCHKSRNIFLTFKTLRSLVEIDYVLKSSKYGSPKFLDLYIRAITKFLKSVIYKDGELPVFNDSFEYELDKISDVFSKLNFRVKTLDSFPISGYEKLQGDKTNILISTSTEEKDSRHFGVGSFEMQYDKKRIVVNCGACIYKENWKRALQETDAHSVVCIGKKDNKSSSSIVTRRVNKNSKSITIKNNGYEKNCKAKLSRKILLSNDGKTIMGRDVINNNVKNDVVIRFHLHPSVSISHTNNKRHLMLKVGKSSGWLFKTSEENISIENSIYFGKDKSPQQTKQIVIKYKLSRGESIINWMFEKL